MDIFDEDDLFEARMLAFDIRGQYDHDKGRCGPECKFCEAEDG